MASVDPDTVTSNLAKWWTLVGDKPPQWLTDPLTDRIVQISCASALAILVWWIVEKRLRKRKPNAFAVGGTSIVDWARWDRLSKLTLIQWAYLIDNKTPQDIERFKPDASNRIQVGNAAIYESFKFLKEACEAGEVPYKILIDQCTPLWEIKRSDLREFYVIYNRERGGKDYPGALFRDQRSLVRRMRRFASPPY